MARSARSVVPLLMAVQLLLAASLNTQVAADELTDGSELAGVVVEAVAKGSALARAGLQSGDLLLSWQQPAHSVTTSGPAEGGLTTYFDWLDLKLEQAPRGPLILAGTRDGHRYQFTIEPGSWEGAVRPLLTQAAEETYREARHWVEAGSPTAALPLVEELVSSLGSENPHGTAVWAAMWIASHVKTPEDVAAALLLLRRVLETQDSSPIRLAAQETLGDLHARRGDLAEALQIYLSVLAERERSRPESLRVSSTLKRIGDLAWDSGDLDQAQEAYTKALALDTALAPGSMAESVGLSNVGMVLSDRGDSEGAYQHHLRALTISESLAPESLDTAMTLSNLGIVAQDIGALADAQTYLERSLRIKETVAPGEPTVAVTLNNLGTLFLVKGDLETAQAYLEKSFRMQERLQPNSLSLATTSNNLGILAKNRGDFDGAYQYLSRALEIQETFSPGNLSLAASLTNLANVTGKRGEFDRARNLFLRSIDLVEQAAPRSLLLINCLIGLGAMSDFQGDMAEAEEYFGRALALAREVAPDGLEMSYLLHNLGVRAHHSGELDRSLDYLTRAMAIKERLAPHSLNAAITHHSLGELHRDRGDRMEADRQLLASLQIRQRLAPDSEQLAQSLYSMARRSLEEGDVDTAIAYNLEAIAALEQQVSKLGGAYEIQASFRARNSLYYYSTITRLIERGDTAAAFHISERFRARVFLAMIAERDLVFGSDIPKELDERRRRIATTYNRELRKLSALTSADGIDAVEASRNILTDLRDQAGEIEALIRQASPRLATLQYPVPLDAERTRQALDEGTILLSYVVGRDSTTVFTLSRSGPIKVHTIDLGEDALRNRVN
jgi:tetratricopeptide (TPR) repeat protein